MAAYSYAPSFPRNRNNNVPYAREPRPFDIPQVATREPPAPRTHMPLNPNPIPTPRENPRETVAKPPVSPPLPRQTAKAAPPSPPMVIKDRERGLSWQRIGFLGEVRPLALLFRFLLVLMSSRWKKGWLCPRVRDCRRERCSPRHQGRHQGVPQDKEIQDQALCRNQTSPRTTAPSHRLI